MNSKCIFCSIVDRDMSSRIVWEDANFIAFLTPFPNTLGFTVLATKAHLSSDILSLPTETLKELIVAIKTVGDILKGALKVNRVGVIFEGFGINHAHVKLIPMHGIPSGSWVEISSASSDRRFYNSYPGYIASHDGPQMSEKILNEVHRKILDFPKL